MDATGALESIAKTLPDLSLEAAESILLTFDTLVGLSPAETRPGAARMLRDAAAAATHGPLRERLLQAARSVEAGEVCAKTPDGLTWQQAAAASTISADQWQEPPLPDPTEDELDADDPSEMADEPPRLPHLSVPHFFPGLAVRVGRDFVDSRGHDVLPGRLLHLLNPDRNGDGHFTLSFLECTLKVSDVAILQNSGNQWFQPVPSITCLTDLWEVVNEHLDDTGELDDDREEWLEALIDEVGQCEEWLLEEDHSGPPPLCENGALAAKVFGPKSGMAVWIPLLFAGVAVAAPEGREEPAD